MEKDTQLALSIVLPTLDETDPCVKMLTERLTHVRGVAQAHIVRKEGPGNDELCLHYDGNLVSLDQIKNVVLQTGAEITNRYRHEQIPFGPMLSADAATYVAEALRKLKGMLHANVNYAAGLVFVAYDTQLLTRKAIEQSIRGMGAKVASLPDQDTSKAEAHEDDHNHDEADHEGHHHGTAPAFLPHWVQERWTLLLIGLAGLFFLMGWVGETFLGLPHGAAIVLYVLAYLAGGYDVAIESIPPLLKLKFSTDVLMIFAALGAAVLGEWREGAFLLFLFGVGHAGEHYALDRARNAVNALGELIPQTAQVKQGDKIVETKVDDVKVGDVVVVRPGDRVPVDGVVVNGESSVDQSPITGESVPVKKNVEDPVFAGTINQDAALEVKTSKVARDNTLSRVMKLVAEAQSQQSPTQQFVDKFAAWFVPGVLLVVVAVIVVPPLVGLAPVRESFYRAMLLLVAASPCALALGTPAAILAGIAQAARNGVLIKGGVHLENMGNLKAIAFDKTGTLTEGKFGVTDVVLFNGASREDVLRIAGAVEQQSNHPLAQAIVRTAKQENLDLPGAGALENVPGQGVRSTVDGEAVLVGSLKLFKASSGHELAQPVADAIDRLDKDNKTTLAVSKGGRFIGVIGLADTLRKDIDKTMAALRSLGVQHLVMLTGDKKAVADKIASQSGLTDVEAELMPEDKLTRIKALQQKFGSIAMIGDGVNDAPALATATVGIAMGGAGTAVALETADVALMGDDVSKLPFAVGLSRASHNIVRQNLVISLGVIAVLIVSSTLGLVQLPLAVVFHEGSTIVVVLNALRLLAYKPSELAV